MKKRTVFLLCMAVAMSGCVAYHPHPMAAKDLLSRAKVQENAEVRVAAYVPGPEEARDLFGADLDKYDVQPVWLRIENKSNQTIFFIHRSLDPDYFTPEEAARRSRLRVFRHGRLLSIPSIVALPVNIPLTVFANRNMRSEFAREGLRDVVLAPGEVISGYVFTHFDQGTKSVKVGYLGDGGEDEVHFFAEIPGIRQDYKDTVSKKIFRPEEIKDVDAGELQRRLEAMPCCVTNKKGDRNGDPLNLVVIGDLPVILNAFSMAGWDETETLSFSTAMKTFKAFLMGKDYSYRYSPVSNLYCLGRKQDVALQKIRGSINSRKHLRLWQTPARFHSKPVWIGQVSRDIGVKFTMKSWYLFTHRIDRDIDESRANLFGDLLTVKRIAGVALAGGVGVSDEKNPRENLTGDVYFTDGLRLVIEVSDLPVKVPQALWPFLNNEEQTVPGTSGTRKVHQT